MKISCEVSSEDLRNAVLLATTVLLIVTELMYLYLLLRGA